MRPIRPCACLLAAIASLTGGHLVAAESWDWQHDYATVSPSGDLSWAPEPFTFAVGETVRYIDYENGDDGNPGTKAKPWKHHPWDKQAGGQAKAGVHGPVSYVFKRGVIYRGSLKGAAQGRPGDPVRLTSDPSWGTGEAVIAGSIAITGGWQRGGDGLPKDVPDRDRIWSVELPKGVAPLNVWSVDGETITRLYVARIPNWTYGDDDTDNIKASWFRSERRGEITKLKGKQKNLLYLDNSLPKDPAFYEGANIYSEWGPVMGTAAPEPIEQYDQKKHAVVSHGFFPQGTKRMFGGQRYYLDDNPRYLDEGGEFWFASSGSNKGRLYLRLPGDADPNTMRIEVAERTTLIDLQRVEHLVISGLDFRFTNMPERKVWPWMTKPEVISLQGTGQDIRISNNTFYHVNAAVVMEAKGPQDQLDDIVISDNDIRYTDNGGIGVREGSPEDKIGPPYGRLGDVALLRNNIYHAGMCMERMSHGHCVSINGAKTAHIAGNILHRTGGWGISVRPGKGSGVAGDLPFTRYIIHQNKVVDAMLFSNDWGAIESWQGGPAYIFNNVVGNPVGYMWGGKRRFAHAYYLDGAFKNYHFNNIAWAESSTPDDHEASASAFQEIHSFQNTWFNNTVYNFLNGSRRQKPDAGRDKFLGNIFQDIGQYVFRHTDSKNTDPNAHDAGQQGEEFAYETNAYAQNVFYDIAGMIGNFHAQGGDFKEVEAMAAALAREHTMASGVGVMAQKSPLRNAAEHDFRPASGSAAIDRGVRVFVPWALSGVVGEWNFTINRKDPGEVIDEHWYMTDYYGQRTDYHATPRYPLHGQGISSANYIKGELEDWVEGALELDGSKQYLVIGHATLAEPIRYEVGKKKKEKRVAQGPDKRTVEMYDNNFLIEAFLRTNDKDGVIAQKLGKDAGYALDISGGQLRLRLRNGGKDFYSLVGGQISDGKWHHVLVDVDRNQGATIYLDGKAVSGKPSGSMATALLANTADFQVGGGPGAEHLAATIDFLRVAQGTLTDAHTSIEELMAWQFDGPQLRDFSGRQATGAGRDAGAIEAE